MKPLAQQVALAVGVDGAGSALGGSTEIGERRRSDRRRRELYDELLEYDADAVDLIRLTQVERAYGVAAASARAR